MRQFSFFPVLLLTAGCIVVQPPPSSRHRKAPQPEGRIEPAPREDSYRPPDFPWEGDERQWEEQPKPSAEQSPDVRVRYYYGYVYRGYPFAYYYPWYWPRTVYDVHEHHNHATGQSSWEFTPNPNYPWWWPFPYGKYEHHHHE